MPTNSKKKGNRGENQLVHILEEAFGDGQFKRTPSSGAYTGGKNREGAENLPWEAKITLVSDIITPSNFNFVVEHKFYESISFWELFSDKSNWNDWIKQVQDDANFVDKEPLLIIKYNRHKRIALVRHPYLWKFNMAADLIWKGFGVVELDELLKVAPREFWFAEEQ